MSFKDAAERAKQNRPKPTAVQVAVDDELYSVDVRRLDGMDWAAVMAECPPAGSKDVAFGYDTNKAALVACRRFAELRDADGELVEIEQNKDKNGRVISDTWDDLFTAISGVEIGALAATWWALNVNDPNQHVVALKKASTGGGKTS